MSRKSNQKGFSPAEPLIGLAVILAIGGVGWYVWSKSNKDTTTNDTQNTLSQKESSDISLKDGYKLYEDSNLKLQHPDKWTSYTEKDQPEWTFFKSPDFKAPSGEGPGPTAEAGYLLEVRVAKSEGTESYEEDLKNAPLAQEAHGGSYKTIKIDGRNAILSDTKSHGTYLYATTYANGKTYYVRLNAPDEDKPEVKELFNAILSTIQIK